MSLQRIWTVIKKDLLWIKGDVKILIAVSAAPAFIILAFSSLSADGGKPAAPVSAADLSPADIASAGMLMLLLLSGCVAMSQLILHEKTKGTLSALLISPLKYQEFLLGKLFFCFALSVCLSAALVWASAGVNLSLFVFLNILPIAGTACLIGCLVGLFSETEMENNALAFLAAMFFVSSFGLKSIPLPAAEAFYKIHPLSHFLEALSAEKPPFGMALHMGFGFLLFFGVFLFAALYVRFYFSFGREKRLSFPLTGIFFGGLSALSALSGLFFSIA